MPYLRPRHVHGELLIDSTTSVSLNGRIDLVANYDAITNIGYDAALPNNGDPFLYQSTGVVTLGKGSVTRILPEWSSAETVAGTSLPDKQRSQINIQGLAAHFDKGSTLWAPSALVNVQAGRWNTVPSTDSASGPSAYEFAYSVGQVYVDTDAVLDVAGSTAVSVPLDQNILKVELRGAELADSPLQRDGVLRAVTLTIDARETGTFDGNKWIGTPLGDATGFEGLIQRGISQLTAEGGSINLQAGESVVTQAGSTLDVSGGWFNNIGGLVKTTKVVQGSRLVDIADATPDQVYDGVYDPKFVGDAHPKWGVAAKTYRNPLALDGAHYEADYIQGAAGGSISIVAPSMALDGKLTGKTVIGPKQLRQNATTSTLPGASSLSLTFKSQDPDPLTGQVYSWTSLHAPKVVFQDNTTLPKAAAFALSPEGTPEGDIINPFQIRTQRRDTVVLSPTLLTDAGFGDLTVDNGAGDISVPNGVLVETTVGGSLTMSGRNIDVQGSVLAPDGSLSFTANNLSPYAVSQFVDREKGPNADIPVSPLYARRGTGRFTLGSSAVLSTAGLTLDSRDPETDGKALAIGGGDIDITSYTANLAAGGLIDVSGGVFVDEDAGVSYGDAGSIRVRTGLASIYRKFGDPLTSTFTAVNRPAKGVTKADWLLGGRLFLGSELRGYSGAKGGALALQAPFIQVGGSRADFRTAGTLLLPSSFFDQGGFGSFDLTGMGGSVVGTFGQREVLPGLVISADTKLAPQARGLFAQPMGGAESSLAIERILPIQSERTPVSLGFHSLGIKNDAGLLENAVAPSNLARGDLVLQDGAEIETDPQAQVAFSGDTVAILGRVTAPGGSISVTGGTSSISVFNQAAGTEHAATTVYLGSKSLLSTAGTTVFTPDDFGRRVGTLLPGGTIDVSGNIVAAAGSVLDVSGASAIFDISPLQLGASSRQIPATSGLTQPLQSLATVPTRLDSDGGTITLTGGEQLFTDATLLGRAGGPTAIGGTLSVSSGRFYLPSAVALPTDANLVVTQSEHSMAVPPQPSLFGAGEQTGIGETPLNADGDPLLARGHFAADTFLEGGFDSLELGGVVRFKGPVDIDARGSLKVADGGVIIADDQVNLSAEYVRLGKIFEDPELPADVTTPYFGPTTPYHFSPTHGPGVLNVTADLIDIGTLSLRNTRFANFVAQGGDIRGSGVLEIAGRLRFEAGQIYTPTASSFTVLAFDYQNRNAKPGTPNRPGSIVIKAAGSRQLPLSAGGTLSFYASNIDQSGTLRAPMGTINLGWDGSGTVQTDLISGRALPIATKLTLGAGSITSVSLIDPATGEGALIPYGVSLDGNSWIDPYGVDITSSGLPTKNVNLSAGKIVTKSSSKIDLRGGGDLYAYRWVQGNGGSSDILSWNLRGNWTPGAYLTSDLVTYQGSYWYARKNFNQQPTSREEILALTAPPVEGQFWKRVTPSFAVIPDYKANYAPIGAYSSTGSARDILKNDAGYVSNLLSVGDRIHLEASNGLPAGDYTLLPARYALLPGAYLVTPKSGDAIGTLAKPDGSSLVSGYSYNAFDSSSSTPALYSQFEVAPEDVVRSRAQYDDFQATRFLKDSAFALGNKPQLLPIDSGHLVFQATQTMRLNGSIFGGAPFGGRGAFIDVSSPADIIIAGADADLSKKQTKGAIVLQASKLNAWDAESLLIGGVRQSGEGGTTIDVQTGNITVDNAGSPLSGPEIILAADKTLKVTAGSEIRQSGSLTGHADSLVVNGDGVLLRVSSDPAAEFARLDVTSAKTAKMTIGAGVLIAGASITLDSSYATDLSPKAFLRGQAVNLSSGQISLRLDDSADILPTDGLVLAGRALRSLRTAQSLSLLSYSSIDIYGTGSFGSDTLDNLEFHAGEIRGFQNDGVASFQADHVLLDNRAVAASRGAVNDSSGTLAFKAHTIELGSHRLEIDQFANVRLNASGGILLGGKGRLDIDGDLLARTPAFFALDGATETIRATGSLKTLAGSGRTSTDLKSGLGASLTLQGASVTTASDIFLPSGLLTLHATEGDVNVGGSLDVGGTKQVFNDLVKYTSGGEIHLISDEGDVNLARKGALSVAAQKEGGNAGTLAISAAKGNVALAGALLGKGGTKGDNGSFSLDVGTLPELAKLSAALDDASFVESRNFRVRNGDVLINGTSTSHEFRLSADAGSILVTGKIDAGGTTGGTISLSASGSLTLADDALLDASGKNFSNAGKGGAVSLEAGSEINGSIDTSAELNILAGSKIDLSVAAANAGSESLGRFTGTLHLRAPQNAAGTDLQIGTVAGTIVDASNVTIEGYRLWDLSLVNGVLSTTGANTQAGGGQVIDPTVNVLQSVKLASATFGGSSDAIKSRILAGDNANLGNRAVVTPGVEIINQTSGSPVFLTLSTSGSSSVATPATGGTIVFPQGTTGDNQIVSTRAGTIVTRDGKVIALAANTPTSIPAGATLTLSQAATVSFAAGGTGGSIAVQLSPGSTYTSSTANASGAITGRGTSVALNTPGTSAVNLAAGSAVLFSTGTPGTRRIVSSVAGTIVTANGATIALAANTPTAIAAGSTVTLSDAGQLLYANTGSGTGAPTVTLLSGNLTTTGIVAITPASGGLTLGTATATAAAGDWDLSSFRFGPQNAPGVLTLRAAGNLTFLNTLSDGFVSSLYTSKLLDANANLPMNAQSWSYRLTAGADLGAADYRRVVPLTQLAATSGSIQLGRNNLKNASNSNGSNNPSGPDATTEGSVVGDGSGAQNRYQVIRTGSGDVDISAGRDVQLLNQFATIYTAGTKVTDPTLGGTFDTPLANIGVQNTGDLGAKQEPYNGYAVQYTLAGGDVSIFAQRNIAHLTRLTATGPLVADSERQLPVNWLYRRGYVDSATGQFGIIPAQIDINVGGGALLNGDVASTSWWVDFSNFFEGVGALGGGDVTLVAGNDVSNVDALIPTNARLPKNATRSDQLVELGGGDLSVRAGHDLDAGVYYVERGEGTLSAGNTIKTNSTRSPSATAFKTLGVRQIPGELSWMPTTLFLGKGRFDVSARGDVLLGPVANTFLLPGGINNGIFYKTTFSTYDASSEVDVSSIGGNVTLRAGAPLGGSSTTTPFLEGWLKTQMSLTDGSAFYQPWLRLVHTDVTTFATATSIMPPLLRATAFTGDLNLIGTFNLSPSPRGTVELAAKGALNALQPSGQFITATSPTVTLVTWDTSQINLSDAAPSAIPGILTPYAYFTFLGNDRSPGASFNTSPFYLSSLDQHFAETGSTDQVLQTKQALHGDGLLHEGDHEPVRIYAVEGDISGLTLFSAKAARVVAGKDITDIALYLQNVDENDISLVAAGRDLIAYDAKSPLRSIADDRAAGNLSPGTISAASLKLAGDIQLAGPGTLEVLAGRNFDLGTGTGNADGTGTGITTVGNVRNPNLPGDGANIVGGAGIGVSSGLDKSNLDFDAFIDEFVTGGNGTKYLAEVDPTLDLASFDELPEEQRDRIALEVFYRVLRDAGRAHTAGTGDYETGYAAIASLFPDVPTKDGAPLRGDIKTRSRDIRTRSGGDISLFAPRGELTLANSTIGNPLVPPGIITEAGGNVSIFTHGDVDLGVGRIFTLKGGDMIIWSTVGDIAAGAASKTVKSAPPTRVLFDPQSADVQTDLAGLSTGGGIGVLATVEGVPPGDVDLIAPVGVVDAGDAGIRVSGNLNIAATAVLNAGNIAVAGTTSGVPSAPVVAAPNIAGLTNASNTAGAANSAAESVANQARQQAAPEETPSIINVEVVGYGGGDSTDASL